MGEISELSEPITVTIPPTEEAGTWHFHGLKEQQASQNIDLKNLSLTATAAVTVMVIVLMIITIYHKRIHKP